MTYLREKSLQFKKAKKLKDMTTKDVWSFVYALFKGLKSTYLPAFSGCFDLCSLESLVCLSRELAVGNLSGEEAGVQILSPEGLGNFLQSAGF